MASIVSLTTETHQTVFTLLEQRYVEEGCGICEKEGSEIAWFNHLSIGAHRTCFARIKLADDVLMTTINELFAREKTYVEHNQAHRKAIEAVKLACGDATISSYIETQGEAALVELFKTVGVKAAKDYAASRKPTTTYSYVIL